MPKINVPESYARFFDTHVRSGVTEGELQSVPAKDIAALAKGELPNINLSENAKAAFKEHAHAIAEFAKIAGNENILFTKDGTWFLPPKVRADVPGYKDYILSNYNGDVTVGTALITLVQNQPLPIYDANGKQLGGFESGDFHGFLTVIDRRTGKVYELHQTFLENSFDPAFRPGVVALNTANGPASEILARLKNPGTELDGVGMISGQGGMHIGDVAYQCELMKCPDKAFNWNGGIEGANFNYVPLVGTEFRLNEQQLSLLLLDRELASRECAVKADPKSLVTDQNAKGFIPSVSNANFPDGSPHYVIPEQVIVDGEQETVFRNTTPDAKGNVPAGAIRVRIYDTVVNAKDMQWVKPYNHHGASKGGFPDADNCFSAVGGMLQNVLAHGSLKDSLLQTLGIKSLSENGIKRMIRRLVKPALLGQNEKIAVNGAVSGDVDVYTITSGDSNSSFRMYDFCDLRSMLLHGNTDKFRGIAGQMIQKITALRKEGAKLGARAANPLLLPTETTGKMIAQTHDQIYGPVAAKGRKATGPTHKPVAG